MRKLAVAVVCIAFVLAIRWLVSRPSEGGAAQPPEQAPPAASKQPEPILEGVVDSPVPEVAERVLAPAPAAAAEPAETGSAACNVFGRVIDAGDAPLASVTVRLQAFQRWSREFLGPQLGEDERARGWELATDVDGRFRFELPAPDETSMIAMIVTPDPFHDAVTLRFFDDAQSRLKVGDNDLGTIRLASTGSIAGVVLDASGAPIEKARVRTSGASERSTTYGDACFTDASGRYVLGHVAPGTYGVVADHEAHLSGFRTPVEVVATRTLDGIDFTLTVAPTLKGRVVDDGGAPLEGIRVRGSPQNGGKNARATTAADGSFTMPLPQEEPYSLEAEIDPNDAFGTGDSTRHYPPNTEGIELVLPRTELVTLAVVDASTGAPVERFGLHVERGEDLDRYEHALQGSSSGIKGVSFRMTSPPRPTDHPGGTVDVRIRPGTDGYHIVATGYDDARKRFAAGRVVSGRYEVRLGNGASLTGRAMLKGTPAEGVTATLESGSLEYDPSPGSLRRFVPDKYRAAQSARTGEDGRFAFHGLQDATRLTLRAPSGESLVVVSALDRDLGDLELQPPGAIAGAILVPQGRSAAGLQVRLDQGRGGIGQTTDANGAFRFESVAPGRHALYVDEAPWVVSGADTYDIDVAPGATAAIEIDLRDRGTCDVSLTMRFSDGPMTGYRVELVPESESKETGTRIGRSKRHLLGTVGEDGRVAGWAPAFGPARVEVRATAFAPMWRHPDALLDLALDARIEEDLVFETASVAVKLAPGFSMPSRASIRLTLSAPAGFATFSQGSDVQEISGAEGLTFDGGRFVFARVPAGELDLAFELFDKDREPTRTQIGPDSWRMAVEPLVSHKARVTIPPGRVTEVALP